MKKNKVIYDPYTSVLDEFNRKNIKYVVVGMSGINYYASSVHEAFGTLDYDVFIKPSIDNVRKAIVAVKTIDCIVSINGHEVDNKSIANIVRSKKTITAADPYGIVIELILAVSGFTYSQMEKDAKIIMIGTVPIRVAQLNKLIASKRIANRAKDKLFLKRYAIVLQKMANRG